MAGEEDWAVAPVARGRSPHETVGLVPTLGDAEGSVAAKARATAFVVEQVADKVMSVTPVEIMADVVVKTMAVAGAIALAMDEIV